MLANPYPEGTLSHQLFQEGTDATREEIVRWMEKLRNDPEFMESARRAAGYLAGVPAEQGGGKEDDWIE